MHYLTYFTMYNLWKNAFLKEVSIREQYNQRDNVYIHITGLLHTIKCMNSYSFTYMLTV